MKGKAVKGGRNTYGEVLGIVMIERRFPRVPGEMGNATTFDFPVRLKVVKGLDITTRYRLIGGDQELLKPFLEAVKELEQTGVRAITSNCGFLILFQDVVANSVNVPVFTSSLLQIPLVYRMIRKDQKVGVITADATPRGFGKKHLEAAGAADVPVVVVGMETSEAFQTISQDKEILYPEQLREDLVEIATKLVGDHPEIGAIVLECANLPPYAKFVYEAVNRPVFDFLTLTNMVYSAVVKREFSGLM